MSPISSSNSLTTKIQARSPQFNSRSIQQGKNTQSFAAANTIVANLSGIFKRIGFSSIGARVAQLVDAKAYNQDFEVEKNGMQKFLENLKLDQFSSGPIGKGPYSQLAFKRVIIETNFTNLFNQIKACIPNGQNAQDVQECSESSLRRSKGSSARSKNGNFWSISFSH
jgi:hypothetical protein